MWPGPYGQFGSRKHLLASLDQSLKRMGLDHVDIFYSHRLDPADAAGRDHGGARRCSARRQGDLCRRLVLFRRGDAKAAGVLKTLGTPCTIHQPSYSMFNRWIEHGLLDALARLGIGCIVFSPSGAGLLTESILTACRPQSRAATGGTGGSFKSEYLAPENIAHVKALAAIAEARGQTLAQMAIAWALRDARVTSALIGARTTEQLDNSLDACAKLDFTASELAAIDKNAVDLVSQSVDRLVRRRANVIVKMLDFPAESACDRRRLGYPSLISPTRSGRRRPPFVSPARRDDARRRR